MPARAHQKLASQLRSLGSRSSEAQPRTPFQPSSTLCMLLNDLREIRSKQADLSNALRASLPADWWGGPAGGGRGENLRLGDRFKLCQVRWLSDCPRDISLPSVPSTQIGAVSPRGVDGAHE